MNKEHPIKIGDSLLWKHEKYLQLKERYAEDKLLKTVKVLAINNGIIKTDFGKYDLVTGKNIFTPCGCKRFCDCYGKLQLKG